MNPLSALSATQVLNMVRKNPQSKGIIDYALSQGLDENDVAAYLSGGQGLTESQRSDISRKMKGKERLQSLLKGLSVGGSVVGAGLGAYSLYKAGAPLAKQVLGMASNAISGAVGAKPDADQEQPVAAPSQSIAQTVLASATEAPPEKISTGLGDIAKQVMRFFGIRSKPLVNAVAKIAESTGKKVEDIYRDLSKSDISTPEKATQAAQQKLKELTGEGQVLSKQDIQAKEQASEKLATAQPIEKARQSLAKSLKSSVIRKMNYNKDAKEMDIIFNNGATYRYYDLPEQEWEALSAGGTPAKTSGKNEFGVWWVGKQPSRGATFNRIIQPKKREAGPYRYEKVGTTPISDEEMEELRSTQKPRMEKAEKLLGAEEKTRAASVALDQTPAAPLTDKQKAARARVLRRSVEDLKALPPEKRKAEAIEMIEDRLQKLQDLDSIKRRKKTRLIDQEILRFEKQQGEGFIKKFLPILPKAVAQAVRDKIGSLGEKDILDLLRHYFMSKK